MNCMLVYLRKNWFMGTLSVFRTFLLLLTVVENKGKLRGVIT